MEAGGSKEDSRHCPYSSSGLRAIRVSRQFAAETILSGGRARREPFPNEPRPSLG